MHIYSTKLTYRFSMLYTSNASLPFQIIYYITTNTWLLVQYCPNKVSHLRCVWTENVYV